MEDNIAQIKCQKYPFHCLSYLWVDPNRTLCNHINIDVITEEALPLGNLKVSGKFIFSLKDFLVDINYIIIDYANCTKILAPALLFTLQ